jgi:hypothetical protein
MSSHLWNQVYAHGSLEKMQPCKHYSRPFDTRSANYMMHETSGTSRITSDLSDAL